MTELVLNPLLCLRGGLVLLLVSMAVGCAMPPEATLADKQVSQFHVLLESGRVAEIYAQSSPKFKSTGSESDLAGFLGAVTRKLGSVQSAERQSWRMDYNTSGTLTTLIYKTQFARGEAMEQFVYQIENGTARLVAYNINSNALVVR